LGSCGGEVWLAWGGERERKGVYILITPRILDVMSPTSPFVVFLDLTNTAVLSTTVSMAFRPAAFMVSPDSNDRR
jgi:hypothetical protein